MKSDLFQALRRIAIWINDNVPPALDTVQPGVFEDQLDDFENVIGFALPKEIREWFQLQNGTETGLIFGYGLLSLEQCLEIWQFNKEMEGTGVRAEGFDPIHVSQQPEGAIAPAYWMPGWLALLDCSGPNYIGIDLTPGPTGRVGQVINFGVDDPFQCVIAESWTGFLELVATEYERGNLAKYECEGRDFSIDGGHKKFLSEPYFNYMSLLEVVRTLHKIGQFDGNRVVFHDGPENSY